MRSTYEHIAPLVDESLQFDGDLIELGVWRGDTFVGMAEASARFSRTCYAVDSWQGMAPPTVHDYDADGNCQYLAGGLAADEQEFRQRMVPYGNVACICPGWIPEVLYTLPVTKYCFAHVDLDQYAPTICALQWVWEEMTPGGIVAVHDYFRGRTILASAGTDEWMRVNHVEPGGILPSHHIWFRKP